jgi:tetratricopeptide (TPR) repeat protein
MSSRSQSRTRLAQLLLGAAPAILLAAAAPADARGISSSLRICEAQDQRRIERAIDACGDVIDERRATLAQIQGALIARANMRVRRNDLTGAAADLEQARRLGASSPSTLVALGQVQARLNDPEAALANFAEASDTATNHDRVASFEAWLSSGAIQLERQQWAQAIESYTRAMRATSTGARQARAYIGRGHARLGGGDLDGAIADYETATVRDADSIDAMLALADGYSVRAARGDVSSFDSADGAYAITLAMLSDAPDNADQRRQLSRTYAGRGDLYLQRYLRRSIDSDLQRATRDFNQAVEANSQNVAALMGRAAVLARSPSTLQRAVADLDRAVRIAPRNADIYRARGDVFATIGDEERAMRDYDQVLALGGVQSYRTYFQRGVIYLEAADYVRADQSFAQALALARLGQQPPGMDPNTAIADALVMRSRATWNLIDAPGVTARDVALRARNYADEAAQLRPNGSRYQAGRCLTRSVAGGEWNTAEQACQTAISLARQTGDGPQLSEAFGAMGMLQLRWALAGAPSGSTEAAHLQYAANFFRDAVSADPNRARTALYKYAQGVALECLGRQFEANGLMREALDHDRSVEARFLSHRIRHCQA